MYRLLLLLCLPALLATQLACIWDRDTLESEVDGRTDAVKIIAGWFDCNPPAYYQMRLDRVTAELAQSPEQLDLYDDAAVACDRLGKPDEAIEWMLKKQAYLQLEPKDAPQPNHHYRTLANLGTFYAHRWLKNRQTSPDTPIDYTDLKKAEALIDQAIKENTDAHFGREKYQLLVIQWLLPDATGENPPPNPLKKLLNRSHATTDRGKLLEYGIPDAVDGLSGMIELGAGWESVDLFTMLSHALQAEGRSRPADMAMDRVAELRSAGRTSLKPTEAEYFHGSLVDEKEPMRSYYATIKEAAEKRHKDRTAYMNTRLARGEHPDVDSDFWEDWREPAFPNPPRAPLSHRIVRNLPALSILTALCLVSLLVVLVVRSMRPS